MAGRIEARLAELGIELPQAAAPAANYVPFASSGALVFVAGQLPMADGKLAWRGQLGRELAAEDGYRAARLCGLNVIAQLKAACEGDLDRVRRILRLGGFVNASGDFHDHPQAIDGASDLMVEVFGQCGRHARAAVGCSSLPFGAATEVEAIAEIDPAS